MSASKPCASSNRRISGFRDTRFVKASSNDSGAGASGLQVNRREATFFGIRTRQRARCWIARVNSVGPSKEDGVSRITSAPARSFTNSSSQNSNAVLPLPRGP